MRHRGLYLCTNPQKSRTEIRLDDDPNLTCNDIVKIKPYEYPLNISLLENCKSPSLSEIQKLLSTCQLVVLEACQEGIFLSYHAEHTFVEKEKKMLGL